MPRKALAKPSPIPPADSERLCSVCGCNWALHGKKEPSLEDCIRLLKAELEMAKLEQILRPPTPEPFKPYREEPYIGKGPERPPRWGEPSEYGKPGVITITSYAAGTTIPLSDFA